MESRKYKHDRYLNKLEKHIEKAKEASRYSSDRFDILLISLSTSALVLSIGFVKNIFPDLGCINTSMLKTSWLLFVLCLLSNLISQVSGYYAHQFDIKVNINKIRLERGNEPRGKQKRLKRNLNIFNNVTIWLNGFSLLFLLAGIIIIVLFFSINI